jgi:hypothetical protein
VAQAVKDVPPLSPFGDDAVRTEQHQVLRNPGMADAQRVSQRFHVALAVPQFLDDANAVRVPKNSKQFGKLPRHENSVRHGSSPSCSKFQKLEYIVGDEEVVAKGSRAARYPLARFKLSSNPSSAFGSTGLTRWWSKPASAVRRRSSGWPQPVKAIRSIR